MRTHTYSSLGLDRDAVEARLAAGLNLPVHTYLDQAVHDFEMEAIFDRSWQYLAPVHRLREPGSFVTATIGRTPVVVTRHRDGELHGFVNACRHRGFEVASGDGSCSRLQCRYHGWIYDLDGTLVRIGNAPDGSVDNMGDLGLQPVSVETFAQAVFVNPDPNAASFEDSNPGIRQVCETIGISFDEDRYVPFSRYEVTQASNWKLWYDNGTECYHCPTLHSQSFGAAYDVRDGLYETEMAPNFYAAKFAAAERSDGALVGGGYRSLQPFPGTQFIQQDDFMVAARIVPNSPSSCTFVADYFAEDGADPARVEEWAKLWSQTYDEDAEVVSVIQQNMASGRVNEMRYVAPLEDISRFYHRLVWDRYVEALED